MQGSPATLRVPRGLPRLLAVTTLILIGDLPAPTNPLAAAEPPQPVRYEFARVEMGMQFKLILYSATAEAANRAATAAFDRIHQLNGILSDYDPQSELSQLSETAGRGVAVHVSDDLWTVLAAAQRLATASDGAFDVTVGPYVKLWRRARREKEMPPPARMAEARDAVGFRYLKLDAERHTAELLRRGMRLDLGGIGVGYAVDEALAVLNEHGIRSALVDGSGDIVVGDPPPGQRGWRIGVAPLEAREGPPSRYLMLSNAAVTTSGDAWQYVELDGQRYSHIVDPRTGLGLTDRSLVIVVARHGIDADSLTKAVAVLGPGRGLSFLEKYNPQGAALVLRPNSAAEMEFEETPNFKSFE